MTAAGEDRPRALFYSHDSFGLGHTRRTLAIAGELARLRPAAALVWLTGAGHSRAFDLPPNLDDLKLPAMDRYAVYAGAPGLAAVPWTDRRGPEEIPPGLWQVRAALIDTIAATLQPRLFHTDHAPAGQHGELHPVLRRLHAASPRPALVATLLDTAGTPESVRGLWAHHGVPALLDDVYDLILITGDPAVFDPVSAYGFSARAAAKVIFCGYLASPLPDAEPAAVRAELGVAVETPLVVVTAGGGRDGAPVVEAAIAALNLPTLAGVAALVVTGPLARTVEVDADRDRPALRSARRPDVHLRPFLADLPRYLAAADVVVTMAGYSSLAEIVALGKRAVVVPRPGWGEEQTLRAERFAALGLVRTLPPADLAPAHLAVAIRAELDAGTSPPPILPVDGRRRAAAALATLLDASGENEGARR